MKKVRVKACGLHQNKLQFKFLFFWITLRTFYHRNKAESVREHMEADENPPKLKPYQEEIKEFIAKTAKPVRNPYEKAPTYHKGDIINIKTAEARPGCDPIGRAENGIVCRIFDPSSYDRTYLAPGTTIQVRVNKVYARRLDVEYMHIISEPDPVKDRMEDLARKYPYLKSKQK